MPPSSTRREPSHSNTAHDLITEGKGETRSGRQEAEKEESRHIVVERPSTMSNTHMCSTCAVVECQFVTQLETCTQHGNSSKLQT
eukprot:1149413-Pelagomonas_calceolata.AAC.16